MKFWGESEKSWVLYIFFVFVFSVIYFPQKLEIGYLTGKIKRLP